MKTWKTVLVEDEPLARQELSDQLASFPQIQIVGEAGSYAEAKQVIRNRKPDLVFLDIDLGTHSGFDLLEEIDPEIKIIFVTAYDEYAIRAFEINALDYLLKPVWPDRLEKCIDRLGNPFSEKLPEQLQTLDQILVKMRSSSHFIKVADLSCIEACGDYTRLYSQKGVSGLVHHTLSRWLKRLPERQFVRIHKSYIVNINLVKEIKKTDDGQFARVEYPEKPIPVSRRFAGKLKESFKP